ncbi:adenylate/guanylate cyclase domain-containing protein [Namhaeicola litoreus]|uniref:Adenylate/guanylate cyclase domain-containing protein n=1 Tax=Namhaeicola litoreus TaxID=1052145 RepID=A0ABW3XX06_9FLAO
MKHRLLVEILKPFKQGIIILLCLSFFHVLGQSKNIDSLRDVLTKSKKDSLSVNALNEISSDLLNQGEFSQSLEFAQRAKKLANEIGFTKGEAYAFKQIGLVHYYQGNYIETFDNWTKSLETFELSTDSTGIANILNNLGGLYRLQGSNAKAIEFSLRSLRIAEKIKDSLRVVSALGNIAITYADNPQDYELALDYYNQMVPYLVSGNNIELAKAYYFGVGLIKDDQANYEEALKSFKEALSITENTIYYAENLMFLGQTYYHMGDLERANQYLDLGHEIAIANDQQYENIQILIQKGIVNQKNDAKEAIRFFEEAETLAKEMELTYELRDIYDGLSKAYKNQGDFRNAYNYQNKYLAQNDSLFNLETDDKIRGLQFDFDLNKKQDEISLLEKEGEIQELKVQKQRNVIYGTIFSSVLLFLLVMGVFNRYRFMKKTKQIIEAEKDKSDDLLLNILPEETALELKKHGKVKAKSYNSVTVLFTDFKGFTTFAQHLTPEELVHSVDYYFSKFDEIMEKYGLEKIKTIGDAYMCAGGLMASSKNHAKSMVQAAIEMTNFVSSTKLMKPAGITCFDVRIGINTGPVVAGVVGTKKFAYDIWGDTVNVAARMESMSEPGMINISEDTFELINDVYDCEYRGEIEAKNKGLMKMYFVKGLKAKKENYTKITSEHKVI